jgi:hypothetical protein
VAGKKIAITAGRALTDEVCALAVSLGLRAEPEVYVGRRIWGPRRRIDVVLKHPETRVSLGIECKAQNVKGTAEEKIPATIKDIDAWPIRGIVVYRGEGFSAHMESYLLSTGRAVEFGDLRKWLELYFGL